MHVVYEVYKVCGVQSVRGECGVQGVSLVPRPHPLQEKGLMNSGRILGPPLRNFTRQSDCRIG